MSTLSVLRFLNVRNNFFHTFLPVLGIAIDVASLVGVLSLINGMELFAREQMAKTTSLNAIEIRLNTTNAVNGIQIRKDSFSVLNYHGISKLSVPIS